MQGSPCHLLMLSSTFETYIYNTRDLYLSHALTRPDTGLVRDVAPSLQWAVHSWLTITVTTLLNYSNQTHCHFDSETVNVRHFSR